MLAPKMNKLLIVGAGLTASASSFLLRGKGFDVDVWEKSRGAGGRMSTSRSPTDSCSTVDVGAQYISATAVEFETYRSFYKELLDLGILAPLNGLLEGDKRPSDGTKDFVTPQGISSISKHYLSQSGANVTFNQRVTEITQDRDDCWHVVAENGKSHSYGAVILTVPTPQILELKGSIQAILDQKSDFRRRLEAVRYSSRYALGLFYKPGTKIDVPWCAKYIDDDCVRFVSIDNKKRNIENEESGPSVVVHTSVPFGIQHLEEDKEAVCTDVVLPRVLQLVPELPKPDNIKCHKWRYSQVSTAYEGQPGAIVLNEKPLLICAGDAFVKSGFNGCLQSAQTVSDLVLNLVKL